ncbi:esterase/lipase family protein [Mycobacterium sp. WMMD1722]|uniref:esterase/lipase family protein n=1 Tax=Mycobacterium sp. WMMD1722 TaxID=3404117 RepID=UPI003BF47937
MDHPSQVYEPLAEAVRDPGRAATQFTRQGVGLVADGSAVAASLVNNIATQIATGFGPGPVGAIPRSVALSIADAAGDVSRAFTGTPFNAASAGRFPVEYGVFNVLAYLTPAAVPPGANDPSISVSPAHPLPVILVNGTGMTAAFNWSVGAPVLANAGYKVCSFNYGNRSGYPGFPVQGVNDITVSAQQLSQEIDRVLAETGAPKVVLVGYSQGGGILPAYYINVLGGGPKVSQVIGLAPSNHGTDLDYLAYATLLPVIGPLLAFVVGTVAPGALQQTITSPFQEVVYGGGDTRPGVLYTNIVSMNDEVLTPYTRQFLSGPEVTNIVIQSRQPDFIGGHGSVLVNPTVWSLVLEALAANPEANPLQAPRGRSVAA